MPPLSDSPDKPPMTHREASWHTSMAGQRGAAEAAQQTSEAARAVVEGSAGGLTIEGFRLPVPCAGSVLCIELLYERMDAHGIGLTHFDSTALVIHAFAQPRETWVRLVQAGDREALLDLLNLARELLGPVSIPAAARLRVWALEQVAALRGDGVEKKTGSPGTAASSIASLAPAATAGEAATIGSSL